MNATTSRKKIPAALPKIDYAFLDARILQVFTEAFGDFLIEASPIRPARAETGKSSGNSILNSVMLELSHKPYLSCDSKQKKN